MRHSLSDGSDSLQSFQFAQSNGVINGRCLDRISENNRISLYAAGSTFLLKFITLWNGFYGNCQYKKTHEINK